MSRRKGSTAEKAITEIFGTDTFELESILAAEAQPTTRRVTRSASKAIAADSARAPNAAKNPPRPHSPSNGLKQRRNARRRPRPASPDDDAEKAHMGAASSPESSLARKRGRWSEDDGSDLRGQTIGEVIVEDDAMGESGKDDAESARVWHLAHSLATLPRTAGLDSVLDASQMSRPLLLSRMCRYQDEHELPFLRYLALTLEVHVSALREFSSALASHGAEALYSMPADASWESLLRMHEIEEAVAPLLSSLSDVVAVLTRFLPSNSVPADDVARTVFAKELYDIADCGIMELIVRFYQAVFHCYSQLLPITEHAWRSEFFPLAEELFQSLRDLISFELAALLVGDAPFSVLIASTARNDERCLALAWVVQESSERTDDSPRLVSNSGNRENGGVSTDKAGQHEDRKALASSESDAESRRVVFQVPELRSPYVLDEAHPLRLPAILFVLVHPLRMKRAEARADFTEWLFALLALRPRRFSGSHLDFAKLWKRVEAAGGECVALVVRQNVFWDLYIPFLAKKARASKSFVVLASLFSYEASFVRESHLARRTTARDGLLNFVLNHFSSFARDPVRLMTSHSREMAQLGFLGDDFALESLFSSVFKHSLYLREVVGGRDSSTTNAFMDAIDVLLNQLGRFFKDSVVPADSAERIARSKTISFLRKRCGSHCDNGQRPMDGLAQRQFRASDPARCVEAADPSRASEHELESEGVHPSHDSIDNPRQYQETRLLCFVAKLVGFWCKSFEDGSWNPSHLCFLSKMLESPKWKGSRQVSALYLRLVDLQRHLEAGPTNSNGVTQRIISVDECNHFMFVLEAVRLRFVAGLDERAGSQVEVNQGNVRCQGDTQESRGAKRGYTTALRFPDIGELSVASGTRRIVEFDEQPDVLSELSAHANDLGNDMLSRFDPTCNVPAKFERLRRNKYVTGKPKISAPDACTCLAVGVSSLGVGSTSKIACSNDLCDNRGNMVECDPNTCPAGGNCQNQRLQKLQYAKVVRRDHGSKGVGLHAAEVIQPDTLIGEYQGEIVDQVEFGRRRREYQGERHFYFMKLGAGLFIDASRHASWTRFINHSCEPNAVTQKWTAGRESRVAIVAKKVIEKDEEITFDYGTEEGTAVHERPVKCSCGAASCRGFLVRVSEKETTGSGMEGDKGGKSLFDADSFAVKEQEIRHSRISEAKRLLTLSEEFRATSKRLREHPAPARKHHLTWEILEESRARQQGSWAAVEPVGLPVRKVEDSFRIPRKFADAGSTTAAPKDDPFASVVASRGDADQSRLLPKMELPGSKPWVVQGMKKHNSKERKSIFAPVGGAMRKDRQGAGLRAPVLRNRRCSPSQLPIDSDSESSCGEYSITSPTVPAGDDAVFVIGLSPGTPPAMRTDS